MRPSRPTVVSNQWLRGKRAGIVLACSAILTLSCASTGGTAQAPDTATDTAGTSPQTVSPERHGVVLIDLEDPREVAAWTTVDDPVMGGRSTSSVTFGQGGLVFSGTISLENNGGFASTRGPQDPGIGQRAAEAQSLHIRALGDGKTYLLKVGTAGQTWAYIQRFATEAAVQQSYELPIDDFEPVGMRLDPAPDAPQTLDPSKIDEVSIYILDKQQGPFTITVSQIGAAS